MPPKKKALVKPVKAPAKPRAVAAKEKPVNMPTTTSTSMAAPTYMSIATWTSMAAPASMHPSASNHEVPQVIADEEE
jgi:hypothetical protein